MRLVTQTRSLLDGPGLPRAVLFYLIPASLALHRR